MDIGRTGRTGANSIVSSLTGNSQLNPVRSIGYAQKSAPARKTAPGTPAGKLEKYAKGLEKQPSFHVIRLEKHQKSMKKSLPNRQGGKARDANSAGVPAPKGLPRQFASEPGEFGSPALAPLPVFTGKTKNQN